MGSRSDELTEDERRIVGRWLDDDPDAGDLVAGLAPDRRRLVLVALGYSTPFHLSMFGL